MHSQDGRRRARHPRLMAMAVRGLAVVGVLAVGGCDWFSDPSPDTARIELQGQDDPEVRVVVSTKFIAGTTEDGTVEVELIVSDTTLRNLPFDTTYDIEADQRFFLEVIRPDTADVPGVQVRVFLDEQQRLDETTTLAEEPLRFLYLFNQPRFAAIEVI